MSTDQWFRFNLVSLCISLFQVLYVFVCLCICVLSVFSSSAVDCQERLLCDATLKATQSLYAADSTMSHCAGLDRDALDPRKLRRSTSRCFIKRSIRL